jgi:hypothetical protein
MPAGPADGSATAMHPPNSGRRWPAIRWPTICTQLPRRQAFRDAPMVESGPADRLDTSGPGETGSGGHLVRGLQAPPGVPRWGRWGMWAVVNAKCMERPPWIGLAQPRNFFGRGRRLRAEEVCAKCKLMLRVGGTFQSTLRYRRSTDPEFFLPRLALIWEVAEKAGFAHSSLFGLFSESGWVVLVRVAGPPSSSAGSQPQSRKLITVYGVI